MARLNRKVEDALVDAALSAQANAHAPYSRFLVGAAVLDDDGRTHKGCNVENVSYPMCVCAERNAIAAAVVSGARFVRAVAIVTSSTPPSPPCGGCRQVMAEFAPQSGDLDIVLANTNGERVRTTLKKLFPSTFTKTLLASGRTSSSSDSSSKRSTRKAAG